MTIKKKPYEHVAHILNIYKEQIEQTINGTVIYTEQPTVEKDKRVTTVTFDNIDSVSAVFKYNEGKTAILNFASYTNPGGGFLGGSIAQEEALCGESTLYPVLADEAFDEFYKDNRADTNHGIYYDRGLYSPGVVFMRDDKEVTADVITVASPNFNRYRHDEGLIQQGLDALEKRIEFVLKIAKDQQVDTLILGAFGCGVFGQHPAVVAKHFKEKLADYGFKHVVFAIIPSKPNTNYELMKGTFE